MRPRDSAQPATSPAAPRALDMPPTADKDTPISDRPKSPADRGSRGHSEMGSRDHGMVEFGVQIPMAPFDSLRSLMAGQRSPDGRSSGQGNLEHSISSESNALSKRSASKGFLRSASAQQIPYSVYIVTCADGSFYVGHTSDAPERVKVHNDGRGALWTACRRPVVLVYQGRHDSEGKAINRERQIKGHRRSLPSASYAKLSSMAPSLVQVRMSWPVAGS